MTSTNSTRSVPVGKIIASVMSIALMLFLYWLVQPALSLAYFGSYWFFVIELCILSLNIVMWVVNKESSYIALYVAATILGIATLIMLIVLLIGSDLFTWRTRQSQIGEVEKIEYNEMIKQIDTAQIPIVDVELAKKQADKKIGEDVALGSRVTLGNPALQEVGGEIIYVIPLEHTGFFKWNANHTTPGYITVSASNPNKVEYVTEVEGKKIQVAYSLSSYFDNDLTRHIRNSGFRTSGLTEYTFEINDEGHPYWVVTTYKNATLWGSREATGVVIVDAQNGATEFYTCDEVPEWVDIIQPEKAIENQIDNWGQLVHGPFNWSNQDKIKKTDLVLEVYVDGDCYYFTGMTSVGSDESCVGFIMVNTRTKKAQMCYMSGATESAAMKSAEGLVSDFGYTSTEPLPLNLNGIPTYVMALKDEEGLIKSYAMVNISNYSIAAKGNSLIEASRAYLQSVSRNSGTYVVGSDDAYGYTLEGKVARISSVVQEGSTYYYIIVEGEEDKIFMASYMVSDELSVTRDGDTVEISYVDDKNGTVDVVSFDNVAFATPKSEDQEERDELDEGTSAYEKDDSNVISVEPDANESYWDSLTDEEKAKIIAEHAKS